MSSFQVIGPGNESGLKFQFVSLLSVHATFALFIKTQYFFCFIIGLNLITVAISLTGRILDLSLRCVISRKESASALMFIVGSTNYGGFDLQLPGREEEKKQVLLFVIPTVAYCLQT